MAFYIILVIAFILISVSYPRNKKLGIIMIVVLFFFSAFRGTMVGTDTSHYLELQRILNQREQESFSFFNLGYVYFVRYLLANKLSERWLIVFLSLVTSLSLYGAAKKTNLLYPRFFLVFLVLFYFSSLNISRQIAAVSILLYGYSFLIDKKERLPWKFLIFVMLASMLHPICIIAIVCPFLTKLKLKKNVLIYIAVFLFVLNAISPFNFLQEFAKIYILGNYYEVYDDIVGMHRSNLMGMLPYVINISLMLSIVYYNDKTTPQTTTEDNIFLLSIIVTVMTLNLHSDVARSALVFTIFQVYYVARFMTRNKQMRYLGWTFIVFNSLSTLYFTSQGMGGLIPYYMEFK